MSEVTAARQRTEDTERWLLHGPWQNLLRAESMQICQSDGTRTDSSELLVASAPSDGTGVHLERKLVNHYRDKGRPYLRRLFHRPSWNHANSTCVIATFAMT